MRPISQSGRNTHDKKDPGPAPAPARDVHPVQCRNVYEYTCYARGGYIKQVCRDDASKQRVE